MDKPPIVIGRSFYARWLPRHLPIRYKLLMHFLLITILPSFALGILADLVTNRVIERHMNANTLQLISKVNRTLEFYADSVQNTTYYISDNPQVRRFLRGEPLSRESRGEALDFLRGFSTLQTEIAGIMVVNAEGDYLSNDMYGRSSMDLTREKWYQEAVAGKGIFEMIGHPYGRNVTTHANYKEAEVVSAVRAVLDPDTQRVLGVVLIDLKLRVIVEAAKDVRLGKTGLLFVLDEHGDPIYVPKQLGFETIPLRWLGGQSSGNFVETVNGRKLQFMFLKSSFTKWATIGAFSTSEAAPEVRQIRLFVGAFMFGVCLLGITASFVLSQGISRPIGRLMTFMQRAESGDLTTRYWGDGMDEVGMLGRSFNSMLTKINDLMSLAERQEKQKREAELRTLQAQIKPHFLYNTLDTIHWMSRKRGAEDVAEMVEALSRLFRIGLSKGGEFIPLAEEFEHVRSYLKIQQLRYRDKLRFELELEPGIAHVPVLKVILQPIVENAIYHGIKERRGPGRITVRGFREDDRIVLSVSDDGAGMDERKLALMRERLEHPAGETPDASAAGYGLSNVQSRLLLTYGDPAFGLRIDSRPGAGTTVTIAYPIQREEI
ncbi:cache domain-containing sensor histidine kinase [Cohnella caldifontis]|uniref:cache domain-containing sensor histidine kinase n=1 Tax=Cohnella caldifontis TaxID=3027471 RepID=UPI0023EBF979|nr:sensor histidine kinase [Cohnella sp. YIM B05605]